MSSGNVVDLRKKKPGLKLFDQAPLPLRPQKRISPVRVRRRRTRLAVFAVVLALVVSCALYASYLSYLPQYSVGMITVQGAQATPTDLITDYAQSVIYNGSHGFLSRANVLLYPKALIEKDIPLEFPRIVFATLSRPSLLSNALTITVTERQPFALWCSDAGACYQMDKTGFLFAQAAANASSTGQYIFTGGVSTSSPPIGQTFAPGHTQGLVAFLQQLDQGGYMPLGAQVASDQDFIVPLSQGYSVYASFGEDPGTLVGNLQLVLSSRTLSSQVQNLEYVDLRFGNKVYYKLKGSQQQQAGSGSH